MKSLTCIILFLAIFSSFFNQANYFIESFNISNKIEYSMKFFKEIKLTVMQNKESIYNIILEIVDCNSLTYFSLSVCGNVRKR